MILDSNDDDSDESDFLSIAGEDVDSHLNHYRVHYASNYGPFGMNNQPNGRRTREQVKFSNEGKIMTLTELAAQKVACHLPFGLVEHYNPPVPEPMQCRIAYWSFPQDEEDVRIYTCLANGNADIFFRAEELIRLNAVCDMLQVGFHLSANVQFLSENEELELFRVAITFDRRRITSCSCSCMTSSFWCQHVVAVCLQRIREPHEVKLRAPVSESLQRLEKNQLQKFAQYLINELPQQILPAAQKLLDELLSGDEAIINKNPAAPDPTAGATINEKTSWCIDYSHITMDIHRILLKQCTTQPTVCSDIQSLHESAPPSTTEYSQLLRPIRGREPEGMWNLIAIVGEMMKRRDCNLFQLLEILTVQMLNFDKILTWWFETKVSMHAGSNIHFSNVKNSQPTSQYSCSNFCDEIVHLWRLAALDPSASSSMRQQLNEKFVNWHLAILEKHRSMTEALVNTNASTKANKRNLLELFPGFKPAMEGCHILWPDWDKKRGTLISACEKNFKTAEKPAKTTKRRKRRQKISKQSNTEQQQSTSDDCTHLVSDEHNIETKIDSSSQLKVIEPEECEDNEQQDSKEVAVKLNASQSQIIVEQKGIVENLQQNALADLNSADGHDRPGHNGQAEDLVERDDQQNIENIEPELQVYFMNQRPESPEKIPKPKTLEDLIRINFKKLNDPLESSYAKVEGLHAHGYLEEARHLARKLAYDMLDQPNYPSIRQLYLLPRRKKKKAGLDNQMSIVTSESLSKIRFLCNVLMEDSENHSLIFKLVLFGVELKRSPASTKSLEVRMVSQKQELIGILKSITLGEDEFIKLREKAKEICERSLDDQSDALTLLILGNYVFDVFVLSRNIGNTIDSNLGFQAALSALGAKINISELDHPLLCEGIRRERGTLALTLINHFKDDQEKLDSTMKQLLGKDLIVEHRPLCSITSPGGKKSIVSPLDHNHPSEASAHFMFELAKTVYDKAGGNSNTAHLFRPQVVAQNGGRGIHRKLHMCTLRIALHALGLHNRTSSNWMHRTYNGRASFIHEQALEIGLPAIKFLCENWQGYLTPVEAASIADKAGCSNDVETKRIAAEMAKSCLKYANYLDYNAVSRILSQCKEQTIEMIEEACSEIEQIAENEKVLDDVLFATARAWHGLYMETDKKHCPNENLYQLNNSVVQEQDTGASGWHATSGQQHLVKCQQLNEPLCPLIWDSYVTPTCKNIEYVRSAFRVGLKALGSLKPTSHMGIKHNPKKLDEILWLLGISKSLGPKGLYSFKCSIIENITDPYILHIIVIEVIKFFDNILLPDNHEARINILKPIYNKCLNRCLMQTKDLMKHSSCDQKSCIETIFEVLQSLTVAAPTLTTAPLYYWGILKLVESKPDKIKNFYRRPRAQYFNINERRAWIKNFLRSFPNDYVSNNYVCDDCLNKKVQEVLLI